MAAACIELRNADKFFGRKQILYGITLSVAAGTVYGLLGPSGCGKTTTVKLMAGISEASGGSVTVLGTRMPSLKMLPRIGYMAQSDALYETLTAEENLKFFGSLYGKSGRSLQTRIEYVMDLVNLLDHRGKPVSAYSGGMKRRLSLAAAILHEPQVLILDEPTVGIDPLLRQSIWKELHDLAGAGVTLVVTTHVMDEAERCTRLAMMRNGFLIGEGTPAELQQSVGAANIEEAFLHLGAAEEGGETNANQGHGRSDSQTDDS